MATSDLPEWLGRRVTPIQLVEVLAVLLVVVLLPQVVSLNIAGELIIIAIFAVGYNLLLGYGGEMSFGHAAFYAAGSYGLVYIMANFDANVFVAMLGGILLATALSAVFGKISLYQRGIYFAMITLALAQMVFFFARSFGDITGGTNGMFLPSVDATIGPVVLSETLGVYLFSLFMLAVVWFGVRRILQSPFGFALLAIRESEERARHLGYNSDRILLITFALSGLISGIAGALHAMLFGFVTPDIAFWSFSGEIVLVTVMGGIGSMAGPLLGAVAFTVASDWLSDITNHWAALFGLLFVLVVMFAPRGLYGLYEDLKSTIRERYQ
jgi:branched-chain amino acid transport system permease protein